MPSGASLFFSAKRTSLSPLSCLSGGLAARLAWLFCVAGAHDDGADDEDEAIILRINAMIVINRKVGARLASVCVFAFMLL